MGVQTGEAGHPARSPFQAPARCPGGPAARAPPPMPPGPYPADPPAEAARRGMTGTRRAPKGPEAPLLGPTNRRHRPSRRSSSQRAMKDARPAPPVDLRGEPEDRRKTLITGHQFLAHRAEQGFVPGCRNRGSCRRTPAVSDQDQAVFMTSAEILQPVTEGSHEV